MSTAEELIDLELTQVGVTESPAGSNRTRYAAEAGHANGQPWCATFQVAMARRLGIKLGNESAYTPSLLGSMPNGPEPRLGALAFFDFPDSVKRVQHVGLVKDWTATSVTCIEGNTSPGSSGSQSNGGGVWIRTRPRSHVRGFAYPDYSEEEIDDMFSDTDRQTVEDLRAQVAALTSLVQPPQVTVESSSGGALWCNGTEHRAFVSEVGHLERWVHRDGQWECDLDEAGFVPGAAATIRNCTDSRGRWLWHEVSAPWADGLRQGRVVWTPGEGRRPGVEVVG